MRWRAKISPSRLAQVSALAAFLALCGRVLFAAGDAPTVPADQARPADPSAVEASPGELPPPRFETTETEIRTDPPASPGARLGLEAGQKFQGMRFQWFQVEGPAVDLTDPSRSSIQVTIPGGTSKLGFVLVAARADLVRLVRISVPIQGAVASASAAVDVSRQPLSWGANASGKVKADAGDDQVGLVGHRVTLNGSRSLPGDGKSARWLQVAGPAIASPEYQGAFFSFVPSNPGTYKFILVVAGDGEVSEPDEVAVLVGSPPSISGVPGQPTLGALPAFTPAPAAVPVSPPSAPTPDQILANALPSLPNGNRVASEVADVMEAIAGRASLYSSFAVLQNELARRLDVVVPADPAIRTAWNAGVFNPLTSYTTGCLLAAGLDARQPQGMQQPLSADQRERVREHFQSLARAFRAAVASR